jgi:hypothetical protein
MGGARERSFEGCEQEQAMRSDEKNSILLDIDSDLMMNRK